MKAYVFPGQGAQFEGMGKDLYESSDIAKAMFDKADEILGFEISKIMFEGSAEELKQTKVTQPAIFLHSAIKAAMAGDDFKPEAVAGHSLGEFSALVAAKVLPFEKALALVSKRALAMQDACNDQPGSMAAILGLEDAEVENICKAIDEVVIAANYNCPGQLVISGTIKGIDIAIEKCTAAGAKRAVKLPVNGGFHSPLMKSAEAKLAKAIDEAEFATPICPIYQNVDAKPSSDPAQIKENLLKQLTSSVRWTQTMVNMIGDGVSEFIEVGGNGKTIRGFVKRVDRKFPTSAL